MIRRPLVFTACLFLIMTIILTKLHPIRGNPPDVKKGASVTIGGRLKDRQHKNNSYILYLKDAAPENGVSGRASALIYLENDYGSLNELPPIGTRVTVRGKYSLFDEATNPGQFDMREYYHIRGIEYRLFNAEIISYGKKYDLLREALFRLRCSIAEVYERHLPEKDSGVLKAMILGDRTSMDPDIKELYQSAGIAHVLSISGLHISILGYGLYRLLKRLRAGPVASAVSCFVFISLYSIMVGGSTSTVRAVIMFGTCLAADLSKRSYDILSALSLSLMAILLTEPLYIYDSGFMLSFGAVIGIAYISPVLSKTLPITEKKAVSGLIASISVNLFTIPVIVWFFYEIPLYSLLLNIIVIPLMGVLTVSAVFMGVSGLFLNLPALLSGLLCRLILIIYERGCLICRSFPNSVLITGRPSAAKVCIYYILLFLLCFMWKRKEGLRKLSATALMLLPLIVIIRLPPGFNYTMLDIGQGDCNIIRGKNGRTVMIDCGSTSEKEIAKYRVLPYLKYMGISRLDAVVLTHTDADHVNGFLEILDTDRLGGIRISCLMLPETGEENDKYRELKKKATAAGISFVPISAGKRFSAGDMDFYCLGPEKGFLSSDENEYSAVLKLKYGGFSALFTGDVQGEGEKRMMSNLRNDERISLLKVSHHGSKYSTPPEFLYIVRPRYSLISAGKRNSYGHPHEELLERLALIQSEIHVTKEEGAITVRTDGSNIKVTGFRKAADN